MCSITAKCNCVWYLRCFFFIAAMWLCVLFGFILCRTYMVYSACDVYARLPNSNFVTAKCIILNSWCTYSRTYNGKILVCIGILMKNNSTKPRQRYRNIMEICTNVCRIMASIILMYTLCCCDTRRRIVVIACAQFKVGRPLMYVYVSTCTFCKFNLFQIGLNQECFVCLWFFFNNSFVNENLFSSSHENTFF